MTIGYKIGYEYPYDSWNVPPKLLIELYIPDYAMTNIKRKNIINPETASYRSNIAFVKNITNILTNKEHYTAESMYSINYTNKMFLYVVNRLIETDYDTNINNECSNGIHFFLSKEVALQYALSKIENGDLFTYYLDGSIKTKTSYKDGKLLSYYDYYQNGKLRGQIIII